MEAAFELLPEDKAAALVGAEGGRRRIVWRPTENGAADQSFPAPHYGGIGS